MAIDSRLISGAVADDAAYRTTIAAFIASLIAAGATQTSDTGQINTTTVTKPVSTNTYSSAGAMFRFSDTLQATKPVFIKFTFGVGSVATNIRIGMQVGTATDGAGSLTGVQVSAALGDVGANTGASFYASCGTDRLAFHWLGASPSGSGTCVIGRTKTEAGADASDGVMIYRSGNAGSATFQVMPFSGAVPATVVANLQFGGIGGATGTTSGATDIAIGGIPTALSGLWRYLVGFLYSGSDLPTLSPVTLTLLGAARAFLTLGANAGVSGGGSSGTTYIAMPWE